MVKFTHFSGLGNSVAEHTSTRANEVVIGPWFERVKRAQKWIFFSFSSQLEKKKIFFFFVSRILEKMVWESRRIGRKFWFEIFISRSCFAEIMLCGVSRKSTSNDEDRYKLFCDDKGRRIRVSADSWIPGDCSLDLQVPAEVHVDNAALKLSSSIADIVGKVSGLSRFCDRFRLSSLKKKILKAWAHSFLSFFFSFLQREAFKQSFKTCKSSGNASINFHILNSLNSFTQLSR